MKAVSDAYLEGVSLGYLDGEELTGEGLGRHWDALEEAKEEVRDVRRAGSNRSRRAHCLGYLRGLREAIHDYEEGTP